MKPYVPCAMSVRAKTSPLSTYAAVIVPRSWRSTASRGRIAAAATRRYGSRRLESSRMGGEKRYAVVSCHVERPLDDGVWARFEALQAARPGGFRVAALMRPPDAGAGEDETLWLERARRAAELGPLGHHTHWGGPEQARPVSGAGHVPGTEDVPAGRVRREGTWLREAGLEPTLFCGGGWYSDEDVAEAVAELGYADCTATAFRPPYLADGAPRLRLDRPARLELPSGRLLLELPSTHSIG